MSAPRLISPLLDNFVMGEPIFDQGGIRILPAMQQEKEEKYIVKIISIPAIQAQVDALLITGAYKDADAVNGYFAELADAVVREAGVLTQLSNAGGFDGYENMQIVPMDDGNGYDVYLLSPYRPTWARMSQQKPVTHLDGYNLALDICAALSVARRNGYLYANLKPDSVSVSPSGSYHLCDLGLISLDYLQYSSLPTAYFSVYTAPEITDAYSSLNSTIDVYALGMMLYEVFNGGLPFDGIQAPSTEYPAPAYAEEEFAQIILKAIYPNPAERWQNPTEMGQAIVSVMQRKGVSDAPIVPVVAVAEDEQQIAEPAEMEEIAEEAPTVETSEKIAEEDVTEVVEITPVVEQSETEEPENTKDDEAPEVVEHSEDAAVTAGNAEVEQIAEKSDTIEEEVSTEDISDDAAVSDDDLNNILEEADKLIADLHIDPDEIPDDTVYEQLKIEDALEAPEVVDDAEEPVLSSEDKITENEVSSAPKKSGKRKAAIVCSIVLLALLIVGGLFFYRHIYLQEVDVLSVSGKADTVSVAVVTNIDSNKLTVVCTDENGNVFEARLADYNATITGLAAETSYTVSLKIDGFHKLIGQTEYVYTTPDKTVISDFVVLNGTQEGTAEVSFQLSGPNEGNWAVTFAAQDEDPHTVTAIGGKAIITGLTLGKNYTVTLTNSADLYLDEYVPQTFTPGSVIKAVDPCVLSCVEGKLTVKWSVPEGTSPSWVVHCYNDTGFNETVTVTEPTASFSVPDDKKAYTVEIAANGQAAKEILNVTENSITLSDFVVDTSLPGRITLNWTSSGDIPEGGYVVTYSVDGVQVETEISTTANSFTILSAVPDAVHTFTFAGANGESILCEPFAVTASGKDPFSAFGIKANNMRFNLCPRPSKNNWVYKDVSSSAYTTTFFVGQNAGVAARILSKYYTSDEIVATVYVFRNTDNAIVHTCFTEEEWGDMWSNGYGTFDIPCLPELPGSYKLDMFIDGGLVHQANITIK